MAYSATKILFSGVCNLFWKNLTVCPVSSAAITAKAMPKPRMAVPANTKSKRTGYNSVGINPASHIPKSVNQPNSTDSGICNSCIGLNCFRRMRICPKIKTQFHKINQVPRDNTGNFKLTTLATDEIGDTPSPPHLVTATPSPEKNSPIINNTYRFTVSLCNLTNHTTSDCAILTGEYLYLNGYTEQMQSEIS